MTLPRGRAARLAAAALAAVPFFAVVAASPASAASSSCTGTTKFYVGDRLFTMPTVGTDTGNLACVLSKGNQSGAVSNLQRHLNSCYWSGSSASGHRSAFGTALVVDGVFGSATASAVAAAQRSHSITADGVYGPETRRTINFVTSTSVCARFGQ
ncbi:Putative peptidoglycan binding domain-containing protein [Micromonospora viridifaciens]|uniref:Putative peptidoglycan binding domain-containing protein n=1 Tax=Micromonospora viridifaciens TaxID=1881 RepID=A0A1C4W2T3_MICVI|nr:peptidoglycan-binding domain-containing protein [Micromonospora viridifaciens]SCE90478.1 Putative peptidoglycan binding domain-containing protein [Micromonospora viridifaciens]